MKAVLIGLALAGLTLAPRPAATQAQPRSDTLRLAEAVRFARETNPMLRAAQASAAAAEQRIGPAGALPDPQLQFGLMNRMASDFNDVTDPMTMNQLQLMQMVPWPGKRGGAKRAARHSSAATRADAEDQARMLDAQVRMAYYQTAYADRALDVMGRTRELLRGFVDVSTTMYAVGSAVQQDVLRAQIEVARMSEEITRMEQERVAMAARLNALLGRSATTLIGALELPERDTTELAPVDTLVSWALAGRPALTAGHERVLAAEASVSAVRRELFPDFSVGFAYQWRPEFPEMMSLMVGINIPLFAGARQLPMRREAAAMRDMASAELSSLQNETIARIIETHARARQDGNLMRLYRGSVVPQARSAVQSALASYRVGSIPFMQLVENQMTVNRYEIETLRLLADYHQAIGELEALVGREVQP
jgi:outer membrane protein TolC